MASTRKLDNIFKRSKVKPEYIGTPEGTSVEYKLTFEKKKLWKYAKTIAAYANCKGGYIIFGIKDKPHSLEGLSKDGLREFEYLDPAELTNMLLAHFDSQIQVEKDTYVFDGKTFGYLYIHPAAHKPVICKKSKTGEDDKQALEEGAIYYRYSAKSTRICYPELKALIDEQIQNANLQWMNMMSQIASNGIQDISLLSLEGKSLNTGNATLYLDESLLSQVAFVKEGHFVEKDGTPALVLKGEVETVSGANPIVIPGGTPTAIGEADILEAFLRCTPVQTPILFIEQICNLPASTLPVFYFMKLGNLSVAETIDKLKKMPRTSQSKRFLIKRLEDGKSTNGSLGAANKEAGRQRRFYFARLIETDAELPESPDEAKYFFGAIKAMSKDRILKEKDYLLNILFRAFRKYYYDGTYSSVMSDFRQAICWVDEVLYKQ